MNHALELPLTYQSLDATKTMSNSFTEREFGLGGVVRAREIIHARGFGPEDFALLDAVFQAAWQRSSRSILLKTTGMRTEHGLLQSWWRSLSLGEFSKSEALEKAAVEMFDRRT